MTAAVARAKAVDYRIVQRHTPFKTKSKVVEAESAVEAWQIFRRLLEQDHANLTPAQRKVIGKQQAAWLESNHAPPQGCEIVPEEEYQARRRQAAEREEASRRAIEQQQKASQETLANMAKLIEGLPDALAKAVVAHHNHARKGQQ